MKSVQSDASCPCGSQKTHLHCCEPLHKGQPATTAEALMRSRFCAYYLNNVDYLLESVSPRQREALTQSGILAQKETTEWTRLEILRTEAGSKTDKTGIVEFKAWYRDGAGESAYHEVSDFIKENDRWYFVYPGIPLKQPGRNEPCVCGSGKKFKKCCG